MGVEFVTCYSCKPCIILRGYKCCDNCDQQVCIKNIIEHKKFENSVSQFKNRVNSALEEVEKKINSLDDELRNKDIYVSWSSDIYQYLSNMKDKKEEIQGEYSNWNKNEITNEYNLKFRDLRFKNEEDNRLIEVEYYKRKNNLEKDLENKRLYHNRIMDSKRNEKNNLSNKLVQTKNNNINKKMQVLNSFKIDLKRNADNNYNEQKDRIDQKYIKKEKKLEYTKEEKETMDKYLNEINKINEYSKIVPKDLINNLLN